MDELPSFPSAIMKSFAIERPLISDIPPLEDELPKANWLFDAWIVSQAISQPTKTFDRPPSFGCVIGDRGNSETASVIFSNDAPPSFTDVARRDASEIASVDQSLIEVNFEDASLAPLDFGEIYPGHDQILLSPRQVIPWNYGYHSYKVHSVMCTELMKLVDRIDNILPEIQACKPQCSSGIQSLCLLDNAIYKAKSLVQNCSESSKLYLALIGQAILSRCERYKKLLEQSLSQIQNLVPEMLASKISLITVELREMELGLDPSEEEAGKVVKALIIKEDDTGIPLGKKSCKEYIRIAALKLHITSRKSLLMEQRSITKLWDKLGEGDDLQLKKQIFMCLLYLLKKYGKLITSGHLENDNVEQN